MSYHDDLELAQKFIRKRQNAVDRGIKFSLTLQSMKNLMRAKRCYYTGFLLTDPRPHGPLRATDRTIDRVDASKGYEPGNVVACCHAANQLKSMCEGGGLQGYQIGAKVLTKAVKRIQGGKHA